jgi:hypothetical protein
VRASAEILHLIQLLFKDKTASNVDTDSIESKCQSDEEEMNPNLMEKYDKTIDPSDIKKLACDYALVMNISVRFRNVVLERSSK